METVYHKMSKTCQHYLLLSTHAKHTFLVYNSFNVIFYMLLCFYMLFYDFSLLTYMYVHIVNIILYVHVCVNVRCASLGLSKIVFYN